MIAGNKQRFAIEAEVRETVDGWILGRFRFWLCGEAVGNWDDATVLKGCIAWLRDFAAKPRDRFEPSLEGASPREVFDRVCDSVMAGAADSPPVEEAFSRFHISHLGMSAFDRFDVLLLKDRHGGERCLWRDAGKQDVHQCHLLSNEMERVATEFCDRFEEELKAR